jgi:hypothetical protein
LEQIARHHLVQEQLGCRQSRDRLLSEPERLFAEQTHRHRITAKT